jgi:cytochrome c553
MKKIIMAGLLMAAVPVLAEENPFTESVFVDPQEYASDPPVSGQMIANNCDACHGTNGRIFDEVMPPLAGIPRDRFIEIMMDFKKEKKPTIIMNHIARAFLDDEIIRMADFFAKQPVTPWLEKSDDEDKK